MNPISNQVDRKIFPDSVIRAFPTQMLSGVLSYFNPIERLVSIQRLAIINKTWNARIIFYANETQFNELAVFCKALIPKLTDAERQKQLIYVQSRLRITTFSNLRLLNYGMWSVKSKIIKILKNELNPGSFSKEVTEYPRLFNSIFKIAEQIVKAQNNPLSNNEILADVCRDLKKEGDFITAVAMVENIRWEYQAPTADAEMNRFMIGVQTVFLVEESIVAQTVLRGLKGHWILNKVAEAIFNPVRRCRVLISTSDNLFSKGLISKDRATEVLELAMKIANTLDTMGEGYYLVLEEAADLLFSVGQVDRAIEVCDQLFEIANIHDSCKRRCYQLLELAEKQFQKREIGKSIEICDLAIEAANFTPDLRVRCEDLLYIVVFLFDLNEPAEAIELCDLVIEISKLNPGPLDVKSAISSLPDLLLEHRETVRACKVQAIILGLPIPRLRVFALRIQKALMSIPRSFRRLGR